MDDGKVFNYKNQLRKIVDSITISNQGHNFGLLFGTPLYAQAPLSSARTDSAAAHKTFELAVWFRDSLMVHSNNDSTRNLWLFDSFTHLCDSSVNNSTRWGLATANWLPNDPGSHLSEPVGGNLAQDSLVAYIKRATHDILIQKSGQIVITRQEIDRKILEFKNGTATEADVQELINLYNSQGGG